MAAKKNRSGISPWHPASLACTWFGCGLLPLAPGTWGSAAAALLAWPLAVLGGAWALPAAAAICTLAGWWAAEIYVRRTGAQDPGEIVIDEVAGQWLVLSVVPPDPALYAAGFLLFRLVDIWKPFPAGWADRTIGGGLGVMADDLLAALWGAAALWGLAWWREYAWPA